MRKLILLPLILCFVCFVQSQNQRIWEINPSSQSIERHYAKFDGLSRIGQTDVSAKTPLSTAIVSKSVTITAGGLYATLTATERSTVTNLTIKGNMDARDFRTMRDYMPLLSIIDLSASSIVAYQGSGGTSSSSTYKANEIPYMAFYKSSGNLTLTNISLPSTITYIAGMAFESCKALKSIVLTSALTRIGEAAFYHCESLISATISTGYDGTHNAFAFCPNLTTITIPNGTTIINEHAFEGLESVKTINISNTVKVIYDYAFSGCSNLETINIPNSIEEIHDYAFQYCSNLFNINIPSSVVIIEDCAFEGCGTINVNESNPNFTSSNGILFNKTKKALIHAPNNLTSFVIPSTVILIKNTAFSFCSNLLTVTIPESIISIGDYAFAWCERISSITFPSINSIGECAFIGCINLSEITIPATVSSIGRSAFLGCDNIITISTLNPIPLIFNIENNSEFNVFGSLYKSSCILYVPKGSKSLYKSANQWKDFTNIIEITTAIPQIKTLNLSVYPNPFSDYLKVKGFEVSSHLSVYNLQGKELINCSISPNVDVPVSSLPKGIYVVTIKNNEGEYVTKIVKE